MENWMEQMHGELDGLHLDGEAKRQILQKIKADKGRYHRHLHSVAALAAVILLLIGLSHLSFDDRTNVPKQFSRPEITDRVEQAAYHAVVYRCQVDENGAIWLEYDVNRKKQQVAASGDAGAMTAYGTQETDAVMATTSSTDSGYRWEPFNEETYQGKLNLSKIEKADNRYYAQQVVYISSFSLVDGDRVLGTWRHSGHSLLENGKVISFYKATEEACVAVRQWIDTGATILHLRIEDVHSPSTLYTDLAGTVEASGGVILTDIQIK